MNRTREVARGLLLGPLSGAEVLSPLGVSGAQCSRRLMGWLLGLQGPGVSCGASPTAEGLLAVRLDASLMGAPLGPEQPTPLWAFPWKLMQALPSFPTLQADPWPALPSEGKSNPPTSIGMDFLRAAL